MLLRSLAALVAAFLAFVGQCDFEGFYVCCTPDDILKVRMRSASLYQLVLVLKGNAPVVARWTPANDLQWEVGQVVIFGLPQM